MYRRGIVQEVDAATHRVRCAFPERDGVVSGWLDVLVAASKGTRVYGLPAEGTQVAVLLDEHEEAGCVVGALYSEEDEPPSDSIAKRGLVFSDGAAIEYDSESHVMTVTIPAGGQLRLAGNTSPLALATKVEEQLGGLRSAFANHTHVAGALMSPAGAVTGSTGAPAAVGYTVGSTGANQARSA